MYIRNMEMGASYVVNVHTVSNGVQSSPASLRINLREFCFEKRAESLTRLDEA